MLLARHNDINMQTITLGIRGDSSSVYELKKILSIKGCDGGLIYEIHNQLGDDDLTPNEEFKNRSKEFYKIFINPSLVDEWACNDISYAAKIDGVWFFAKDTGSNTYLGTGPTSTLNMREYCFNNNIKILYIENSFEKWVKELFNIAIVDLEKNDLNVNGSSSYKSLNSIIKRLGDGVTQTIKTASKLSENNFRDLFLCGLQTHPTFNVTAESNFRKGRTDLLICDRQLDIPFIYEFKIHNGNKDIEGGIQQIIKQYPTPRNKYNGLIFINRKKINLATLQSNIESSLHNNFIQIDEIIKTPDEQKIIVKHKHFRQDSINCILTIYVFDIQED